MSIETYLTALNDQQKIAVMHTEGPSMVIAGAGSGKTRVLTTKIAHILKEKKASPYQILALTFTNKAADEMRVRIEKILGNGIQALWLGTFHSVFMKLLRLEAESLGYPKYFSIYDADDSKSLVKTILKELALDDKIYKPNVIISRISHAKNRLITPEDYAATQAYQAEDNRMRMPRFSEIFLRYSNRCLQAGAMDFDDLLMQTHKLLYSNPTLSLKYQQQFHYLFIDEFQDTNLVQYQIVKKLSEYHHNICVVGDDAQSIYAFRGADIQNILNFSRDYPDHHIVKLEQNYRSTQHIVASANCIIGHNTSQLKKKVWTTNALGEPIEVVHALSDLEESQLVVQALLTERSRTTLLYQDFAILYRTNNQSRHFEETLRRRNVPYRIVGGLSFYQRKEVKDLLAYLRFIVNHNDTEAFKRIINVPKRGIGPTTIEKITARIANKEIALWEVLQNLGDFLPTAAVGACLRFVKFIEEVKVTMKDANAYTIADYMARESGLLKQLYEDQTVEGLARYGHIQELLNSIKQFVDNPTNQDTSLGSFLQDISLMTKENQDTTDKDMVTLMTIHSAKGLEFKYVYLTGMEEGLFPSAMMLGSKEELEEERRLFYVAVTRTQLKLTLSYACSRYRFGKLTAMQPSRFLKEISNTKKTTLSASTVSPAPPLPCSSLAAFQVGNNVQHAHFGEGKILELLETVGTRKAVVLFHNVGTKTLLLNYAKLELLPTKTI